jgi:hypothetical protein
MQSGMAVEVVIVSDELETQPNLRERLQWVFTYRELYAVLIEVGKTAALNGPARTPDTAGLVF